MMTGDPTGEEQAGGLLHLLRERGAYLEGHFLLTSGRHSSHYIEKFRLLESPRALEAALTPWARAFRPLRPTRVVGPAVGGILLAYELARQLGTDLAFLEKGEGPPAPAAGGRPLLLRRGFRLDGSDRVILVEDVVTTGGSLLACLEAVQATGARVAGVGALVDRSGGDLRHRLEQAAPGVPLSALLTLDLPSWAAEACPLCRAGLPLEERGSGGRQA